MHIAASTVEIPPLYTLHRKERTILLRSAKKAGRIRLLKFHSHQRHVTFRRYAENIHFSLCIHVCENLFPVGDRSGKEELDELICNETAPDGNQRQLQNITAAERKCDTDCPHAEHLNLQRYCIITGGPENTIVDLSYVHRDGRKTI